MQVEQRHREAAAELYDLGLFNAGSPDMSRKVSQRIRDRLEDGRTSVQFFARFEASLPPSAPVDREAAAKIIFEAMRWAADNSCTDKHPEWEDGGNSLAQDKARRAAAALASNDCLLVAEAVRERCAGVADDIAARYDYSTNPGSGQRQYAAKEIASTIRGLDLSGVGVG